MKVKKVTLLAIASVVWLIAGLNILKIGVSAYQGHWMLINGLLSMLVFALFQWRVFGPLVVKHTQRILKSREDKLAFWKFFDGPSFLIMFFMMGMGISIRHFALLPEGVIAWFYTGLGASLALAGVGFARQFFHHRPFVTWAESLVNMALLYFLLAMSAGVVYRELTKAMAFTGRTSLGYVHGHWLILGMGVCLALLSLDQRMKLSDHPLFKRFFLLYHGSLLVMGGMMMVRGILTVLGTPLTSGMNGAISGIAGLSHIGLLVAGLLFFKLLKVQLQEGSSCC